MSRRHLTLTFILIVILELILARQQLDTKPSAPKVLLSSCSITFFPEKNTFPERLKILRCPKNPSVFGFRDAQLLGILAFPKCLTLCSCYGDEEGGQNSRLPEFGEKKYGNKMVLFISLSINLHWTKMII